MSKSQVARRYAPLMIVVAAQLLIVLAMPSTAPDAATVRAAASTGGAASAGRASTSNAAAGTTGAAGTATAGAGGAASGAASAGDVALPPGVSDGDTSHCVNGRQFDPTIIYFAPPCVPGQPGAPFGDNGGATYQGVSATDITLVDYLTNYGPEGNAILSSEGLLETYDAGVVLDKAFETFLNEHYNFYGRKVHIVPYQGECSSLPPDTNCLVQEMSRVVDTYQPFGVFWNTTVCSACFAELARRQVLSIGGIGFSDDFAAANAPYFYSFGEGANRIQEAFAEWWCAQMTSNNSSRVVKHAGTHNPAQNFNGQKRVLGMLSTNDPDNQDTVKNFLVPLLRDKCGENVDHFYFYAQDINTAAQQTAAAIAAMNTPTNPATVVLCLCDQGAPSFLYGGEQQNNYWPENIIATNQNMDLDTVGQSYGPGDGGSPSLACPTPSIGCEYDLAFGLGSNSAPEPQDSNDGTRMFALGGGQNLPVTGVVATQLADTWAMLGALIEGAGPNLTPANVAAQASGLGMFGGGSTGKALVGFPSGSGYFTQDARIAYWDRSVTSPYNGKAGAYVEIEGARFDHGQYPNLPDGPPIPERR